MALDLDDTNPMYLLGRVVAAVEAADPRDRRVADHGTIDVLLARPAAGFAVLARKFDAAFKVPWVQEIIDILPSNGLPKGPVKIENQGPYWLGYYHQRGADRRDASLSNRFTAARMRQVGETLFGPDHWQAEMTRALKLSDSSRVRAFVSDNPDKRRKPPAGVCRELLVMLRQKSAEATALADEIDAEPQSDVG